MVARMGYKMLQRTEEKRTEASLGGLRSGISTSLDQMGKKTLCQILRVIGIESFPAEKQIERSPIKRTEL